MQILTTQEPCLKNLLKHSDIFILPSFFEGLPLVIIEALASGIKVITTDLPRLDDFVGKELKKFDAIRYMDMPRLKILILHMKKRQKALKKIQLQNLMK